MKSIVIIDDDMNLCEIIKDCLDEEGYQTRIATRPSAGLELVAKHHPDLVLLDVLLPGTGGLDCIKTIRRVSPQSLVVIISGVTDEAVIREFFTHGALDYIHKPFNFREFKESILNRIF